jgi:hypothetical protein
MFHAATATRLTPIGDSLRDAPLPETASTSGFRRLWAASYTHSGLPSDAVAIAIGA